MEDNLEPGDIENLRHMLGADGRYPKNKWGFRNHYAAGPADEKSMERLVSAGLALRGHKYEESFFYHATKAGCKCVGLDTRRTLEALTP